MYWFLAVFMLGVEEIVKVYETIISLFSFVLHVQLDTQNFYWGGFQVFEWDGLTPYQSCKQKGMCRN